MDTALSHGCQGHTEQGVKLNLSQQGQGQGVVGKTTQGVEKGIGAVTKGLKGLFGK
ncbi:MAG: hypothetical protein ABSD38_38425 [Syntrophorhabdales bacterium]|jgi:hypothetical protein